MKEHSKNTTSPEYPPTKKDKKDIEMLLAYPVINLLLIPNSETDFDFNLFSSIRHASLCSLIIALNINV